MQPWEVGDFMQDPKQGSLCAGLYSITIHESMPKSSPSTFNRNVHDKHPRRGDVTRGIESNHGFNSTGELSERGVFPAIRELGKIFRRAPHKQWRGPLPFPLACLQVCHLMNRRDDQRLCRYRGYFWYPVVRICGRNARIHLQELP